MDKQIIEIDSNNLLFNYNFYKEKVHKKIIAIIKDNAYGHGFKEVCSVLNNTDVLMYAVSSLKEAIEVSKCTTKDILILDKVIDFKKVTKQMVINVISKNHLLDTINSKQELRIHLVINTGMNRKGILPSEFDECKPLIDSCNHLKLEGVSTHYASNKKKDLLKQYNSFLSVINKLDKDKYLIHASSSVSSLLLKEDITNTCRIGIGLYGLDHRYRFMKELKPVLNLYTYIDNCMFVKKNTKVGYSYLFKTKEDGYLILSPLGYGLGYLIRKKYFVYYNNQYLKQMSRVCMDCCIYFSKVKIEDNSKIEILGNNVKVDDLARINKCSPYEIVTLLNKDIKRIVI